MLEAIVAERPALGVPLRQRTGTDEMTFSGVACGAADRSAHTAEKADGGVAGGVQRRASLQPVIPNPKQFAAQAGSFYQAEPGKGTQTTSIAQTPIPTQREMEQLKLVVVLRERKRGAGI